MSTLKQSWLDEPIAELDREAMVAAQWHQSRLTKPAGALGRLEELAIRLASMQSTAHPSLETVRIVVFAADHGIAKESVSAYPQSVTAEMVRNFARGGAAVSVLARELRATLEVVNLGTVIDVGVLPGVRDERIAAGSANFLEAPAMTAEQLEAALGGGRRAAERARAEGTQLFIGGEMGIGNTTSASALAAALLRRPARDLVGAGTGLDGEGVRRKTEVIERGLARHADTLDGPMSALACLGGFEIAALSAAFLRCAQLGMPVLVDGFIASVAALVVVRRSPACRRWFFYGHRSTEPGHAHVLAAAEGEPLLDLGMRLGEGSGAAVAVPLLRLACALHNQMATFDEAGVSSKV